MGRAKLGIGEVATIRTKKLANGNVRAYTRTRLRDGSRVQVQADGPSATKAKAAVVETAKRRAHTTTDGIGPATLLRTVAVEHINNRERAGKIGRNSADLYRDDVRRASGRDGITDLPLGACTPHVIQSYLANVSETNPSTAKRLKGILRGTFAYAAQRGADLEHPAPVGDAQLSPPTAKAPRAVAIDDLQRLRQRVEEWQAGDSRRWQHLSEAVDVMLGTGMRIGELLAIRWQDVNLAATPATVTVRGTVVQVKGDGIMRQAKPKTDSSVRTLPLPAFAVAALLRMKLDAPASKADLVFASRSGGPMSVQNFGRRWREVRGDEFAWVTPHAFRRTVATLVNAEVGIDPASAVLGHSGTEVTRRHYIEKVAELAPDVSGALDALGPGFVKESAGKVLDRHV